MVKHFCDRCERPMSTEDFDPFIRVDMTKRIIVSLVAMNEESKPINDLCNPCKRDIVLNGEPTLTMTIPKVPSLEVVRSEHRVAEMDQPAGGVEKKVATLQPTKAAEEIYTASSPSPEGVQPAILPDERPSPRMG